MALIYKITNPLGETYIGCTTQKLFNRKAEHKYLSKKGKGGLLYDSLRKHGFENHDFDLVCEVAKDDAYELEHFIIKEFNPKLNKVDEYNATATGKIWVNDGVKEFQIYPNAISEYQNVTKGRIKGKLGRKPYLNTQKYVM